MIISSATATDVQSSIFGLGIAQATVPRRDYACTLVLEMDGWNTEFLSR